MESKEKGYLKEVKKVIEAFGTIHRDFVLDKTGIRAIIRFIEDLEGRRPFFEMDDPVVQKGRAAVEKMINDLNVAYEQLEQMEAPAVWKKFHSVLVNSLEKQVEGYSEMAMVFEDSDLDHVMEGQALVNEGMRMLEEVNK